MKKLFTVILCLLLCTGCTSKTSKKETKSSQDTSSTDSLDDSFYPIVNLGTNLVRETFYQDFSSSEDFQTIGRELQALSTDYFSTSDYYMSEGLQLVQNDKNQLLKKEKYSLQPLNGELVDGQEINKMVENISEQDYYEKSGDKYTLKGMSIAIILDPKGGTNATLSEGSIDSYAKETISRLYKYLQTKKSVKDIPTFIAVYRQNDSEENSYNGRFIYSGVVGYGKYKDGSIQSLKIQITASVKSYTELIYVVETVADQMDNHFSGFDSYAVINDQDGLKAVVIKNAGKDAQSTLLY